MHPSEAEQRAIAARHVARFLELKPELLEVRVIHQDRPDFVLVIAGRRIGLEHQELTEQELPSNEPNLDWLERALSVELRRRGMDAELEVVVGVNPAAAHFRTRRVVEEVVPRVADLVAALAPTVTGDATLEVLGPELAKFGVIGPACVYLSRSSGTFGGPTAYVQPSAWGPVGSSVGRAIRSKEGRLPAYAADLTLTEVWLLLVTGEKWQATDSVLRQWTREPTMFARVYLMDLRTSIVQRVDNHAGA